jgi:hypothetical protein
VFGLLGFHELPQFKRRVGRQYAVLNGRTQDDPKRSNRETDVIASETTLAEADDEVFDAVAVDSGQLRLAKLWQHVPFLVIDTSNETRILTSFRRDASFAMFSGAREGLKGKPVKIRRGPATVTRNAASVYQSALAGEGEAAWQMIVPSESGDLPRTVSD